MEKLKVLLLVIIHSLWISESCADTVYVDSLLHKCWQELNIGNVNSAMTFAFEALQESERNQYQNGVAWANYYLANTSQEAGNLNSAELYYDKAFMLGKLIKDTSLLAKTSATFGRLLVLQEKYKDRRILCPGRVKTTEGLKCSTFTGKKSKSQVVNLPNQCTGLIARIIQKQKNLLCTVRMSGSGDTAL